MRVKEIYDNKTVDIFGIFLENNEENFLGLSKKDKNLTVYKSWEIEILNAELTAKWCYLANAKSVGIYHWALIEEQLLDCVLKEDKKAFCKFIKILECEGQI